MSKVSIQVRIDEDIKRDATELFDYLGIDMSTAVSIFLRQCVLNDGLPFKVEQPEYSTSMLDALEEYKRVRELVHKREKAD